MNNTISSKTACTLAHEIRRKTGCSLAEAFKAAYAGKAPEIKTTWTRDDLDKVFSDKTAELLRKGYTIYTAAMGGHQGEIAKMIFQRNDKIYILKMEDKHEFNMRGLYNYILTISFGEYTGDPRLTIWIDRMDTTWSMSVVKITNNWFVTEELAKAANKIWMDRCKNRDTSARHDLSIERYGKLVIKLVNKTKGNKGKKVSDLSQILKDNTCGIWTVILTNGDHLYFRANH